MFDSWFEYSSNAGISNKLAQHPKSIRDFDNKQWRYSFPAHNGTKWETL